MKHPNILMTHLTLQGEFHQVSLYSSVLYLWTDSQHVRLYHWHKWMKRLNLQQLPVYREPFPLQTMTVTTNDLEPFFIKEIAFEKPVRDFVLFRHQLYCIDEDGLFVVHPESAQLVEKKLAAGNFHAMSLSEKNRLALTSNEDGLFEYLLAPPSALLHWDQTPTASVLWDGHDLLQLDENEQPIGRLDFERQGKNVKLTRRLKQEELKEHDNYYHSALDLMGNKETQDLPLLFDYLPSDPTAATQQNMDDIIPVQLMPHRYLHSAILTEDSLYLEKKDQNLYFLFGDQPYTHLPKKDYTAFHLYPKSRNYRHHLHLVADDRINFLLFHQLG